LYVNAPPTPYTFTAFLTLIVGNGAVGIGWESNAGAFQVIHESFAGGLQVNNYTNATTFGANQATAVDFGGTGGSIQFLWLQIHDDGTNVSFKFSTDGVNFTSLYTVAKSSGALGTSGYNRPGIFFNSDHTEATFWSWAQS
jgi:hypothetical protein